ncbi:MAG: helix-turn-helix domain-containing protein, partial [Myxococcales bacterium]|nr:helix-turn-helix domain-containing protein [Myxococcales bacterium]
MNDATKDFRASRQKMDATLDAARREAQRNDSGRQRAMSSTSAERALEPAVGDYLRRERELRAVSLEEIAQTTRIPLKVLRDLENDRHEQLPGDVFVRGFLRSYSRALGLDDTQVV